MLVVVPALGMICYGWYCTAKFYKGHLLHGARQMLQLVATSRRKWLLLGAVAIGAGGPILVLFEQLPALWALEGFLAAAWLVLNLLQPPVILVLASSVPETFELLGDLDAVTLPCRHVSLLDEGAIALKRNVDVTFKLRAMLSPSWSLRAVDDAVWRERVRQLAEMVPLVLVDTRVATCFTIWEAELMLQPQRQDKAIFVVGPAGYAPTLASHGVDASHHRVRTVSAESLPRLLSVLLS